jgi:hypothetical protein
MPTREQSDVGANVHERVSVAVRFYVDIEVCVQGGAKDETMPLPLPLIPSDPRLEPLDPDAAAHSIRHAARTRGV